jgi:hypothetical protein
MADDGSLRRVNMPQNDGPQTAAIVCDSTQDRPVKGIARPACTLHKHSPGALQYLFQGIPLSVPEAHFIDLYSIIPGFRSIHAVFN